MIQIRKLTQAALVSAFVGFASLPALAEGEVNISDGYAVHGYDVVAYFTDGAPVEGDDAFITEYEGAAYRFSSADNLAAFEENPAQYAPQYGGYCAFGTAMGRKFDGDPNAWAIVDDKLYLNVNPNVQERWQENPEGFIKGADHNWSLIASVPDNALEASPPEGITQGAQ